MIRAYQSTRNETRRMTVSSDINEPPDIQVSTLISETVEGYSIIASLMNLNRVIVS
jgi:hypothetical protein